MVAILKPNNTCHSLAQITRMWLLVQIIKIFNSQILVWFKTNAFHRHNSYMISKGDCCSVK